MGKSEEGDSMLKDLESQWAMFVDGALNAMLIAQEQVSCSPILKGKISNTPSTLDFLPPTIKLSMRP